MNRFHSSGTPERERRGDVDVEDDHPDHRDRPDRAAGGEQQQQRQPELDRGAQVGGERRVRATGAGPPGSRGRASPSPSATRFQGVLRDHHRDHEREVAVELRGGGAPPDADEDELPADDQVLDREQEDDSRKPVDLGARGEERDLVAQAEQPEQRRAGPRSRSGSSRPAASPATGSPSANSR